MEEVNRQQNLLRRARGDAYEAYKAGWFSWSVREIDPWGEWRDLITDLNKTTAVIVAEELRVARTSGLEDGYEQGAEWGTRAVQE